MYHDSTDRAFQLLAEWLSEKQLRSLRDKGYFTVRAARRGLRRRRYRVYYRSAYNVRQVFLGFIVWPMGYCVYPRPLSGYMLPLYDMMLAQAVWLTGGCERQLRQIACRG